MYVQMFAVLMLISSVSSEDRQTPMTHPSALVNGQPLYLIKPEPIFKKVDFLNGPSISKAHRTIFMQHSSRADPKANRPATEYLLWPTENELNARQMKRALFWDPTDFASTYKQIKEDSGVFFEFPGDLSYRRHRDPVSDSKHDETLLANLPFGNKHVYPKRTYGPFVYRFLRFPSVLHKLRKFRNYMKKSDGRFLDKLKLKV